MKMKLTKKIAINLTLILNINSTNKDINFQLPFKKKQMMKQKLLTSIHFSKMANPLMIVKSTGQKLKIKREIWYKSIMCIPLIKTPNLKRAIEEQIIKENRF